MKSLPSMLSQFRKQPKARRRGAEHSKTNALVNPAIERLEDRTLLAATLLQGNAALADNRIDLVIVGDGYTDAQIGDGSLYANHVNSFLNYLFDESRDAGQDPFARYEDFFNVWRVDVASIESGADIPAQAITVNTALNATYSFDGMTEDYLYIDEGQANFVLNQELSPLGVDAELRVVLVNSNLPGGGGVDPAPGYAVFAAGDPSSRDRGVREMGRAFSNLGLENDDGDPMVATPYAGGIPTEPNLTINSGFTPWAFTWQGFSQPGIGVIGAYEGALGADTGIFRPSLNSKLRTLGNPFDAVSREAMILDYYDFVDPLDSVTPAPGNIIKDPTREFRVTAVGDNPVGFSTTLTSVMGPTDTVITVADASGFPGQLPYEITIDDEQLLVIDIFISSFGDDFLLVQRGINGTMPASHAIGSEVSNFVALNGAIDASQTTIVLSDVSLLPAQTPYDILVDNEQMTVTGVDANTRTLTVIRGVNGTVPVAHADGAIVTTVDFASDLFRVQWRVNGQLVVDPSTFFVHTERTFTPADFGFDSGFFTVSATVTDISSGSWVRQGQSRLQQTVNWTVNVPPVAAPVPVSPVVVAIDALPTFQWNPTDSKAAHWELQVIDLTSGDAPLRVKNIIGNSFTPTLTQVKDTLIADHTYRWHVRGIDATGNPGDWTQGTNFTLRPNRPTLRNPTIETADTTPTFEWSPVNGAIKYDIWVNDQTTGQSAIIRNMTVHSAVLQNFINATTQTLVVTDASGLPANTPFLIQVDSEQMEVIAVNGNTLTVTRGQGGTVRVSHSGGSFIQVLGTPTFTPVNPLPAGHSYIWTVRPIYVNDIGGQWATHKTFQILGDLGQPTLLAPIRSETATTTPTFEWTAVEGADFYDIWVNDLTTGQSAVIRNKNVGDTVYVDPLALEPGHEYLWTLRAGTSGGQFGPWARHQAFKVVSPVPAPKLEGPNPLVFSRTPQFRWSAVPGAVQYDLWVNNVTTGQSGVIREKTLTTNSFTPTAPLMNGHHYIWTVRAITADGTQSPQATHRTFSVGGVIPKPVLADLGLNASVTPTFNWSAVTGAVRYDLWVNVYGSNETVVRVTNVNTNSFQSIVPLTSGKYYIWTVQAIDADGNASSWADHRIFRVAAAETPEFAPVAEPADIERPEIERPVETLVAAADEPFLVEPSHLERFLQYREGDMPSAVEAPNALASVDAAADVENVMAAWENVEWWADASEPLASAADDSQMTAQTERVARPTLDRPMLAVALPLLAGSRLLKRKHKSTEQD